MKKLDQFRQQVERAWLDVGMKPNMSDTSVKCFRDIFTRHVSANRHLAQIAESSEEIDFIRNNAYSHPLGFRKYTLFHSDVLGGTLRFHVWGSSATALQTEDAHTHRWSFYSVVLLGCMKFEEYALSREGLATECFSCSENVDGKYDLVGKGTRRIHPIQMHEIHSGAAYCFSNSQIHRVMPSKCLTKTLVLQLDTKNRSSQVYRSKEINNNKIKKLISISTTAHDLCVY